MTFTSTLHRGTAWPSPKAVLELLKPVTWFAPMWAFLCGALSSGTAFGPHWWLAILGIVLAGPLVCGTSQAINDWFDRHVDAINEPHRPIPSGRIPGFWGLWIACAGTAASLLYAAILGPWVFGATIVALLLAWAYSAPPVRLKMSGLWGPAAVALSYEGLTWFTGAAVMLGSLPSGEILALAALYSVGAHGIMTLNDFKAVEGDRRMGIRSLPVTLGTARAAKVACLTMAIPQLVVAALLVAWDHAVTGGLILALTISQLILMARLLSDPRREAAAYNASGTLLYVLGMLSAAIAVGAST